MKASTASAPQASASEYAPPSSALTSIGQFRPPPFLNAVRAQVDPRLHRNFFRRAQLRSVRHLHEPDARPREVEIPAAGVSLRSPRRENAWRHRRCGEQDAGSQPADRERANEQHASHPR
jgi:hypothetical protein